MTDSSKGSRPVGLSRVVLTNTALALVIGGVAWMRFSEGHTNVIAIGVTVMLVLLGPGLLIRHRLVWRLARPFAYVCAMVLSLLVVFAIIEGQPLEYWFFYGPLVLVVLYLIGMRGYLSGQHVAAYYGVELDTTE